MNDVPFIKQEEPNECGVAALTSIASYYLRRKVDYGEILRLCHILTGGLTIKDLCKAASQICIRALPIWCNIYDLEDNVPKPCIALWNKNHYIVITQMGDGMVRVVDPALGHLIYNRSDFVEKWYHDSEKGVAIAFEKTI